MFNLPLVILWIVALLVAIERHLSTGHAPKFLDLQRAFVQGVSFARSRPRNRRFRAIGGRRLQRRRPLSGRRQTVVDAAGLLLPAAGFMGMNCPLVRGLRFARRTALELRVFAFCVVSAVAGAVATI
jgi:hypothetical protein